MKNIIAALVDVQTSAEAPKKNAANPHFKSKFADLAQILSVLRAPLMANGLAVVQSPSVRDDGKSVCVQTTIYHSSGEVLDCGVLAMPVERPGPQAVGSAITYARRYALQAIFCLAAEDDDGESAELRDGKAQGKPARGLDDVAATKASPAPKPTPVDGRHASDRVPARHAPQRQDPREPRVVRVFDRNGRPRNLSNQRRIKWQLKRMFHAALSWSATRCLSAL
jgi:hypothetical protein